MTIGASIFIAALGAILRFAVTDTVSGIDIQTVGTILIVAGLVGLVAGLALEFSGRDRGARVPAPTSAPLLDQRLAQRDGHRVHAAVGLELGIARLVSDLTVSGYSPILAATCSVCRPSASSCRISRSRSDSGASATPWVMQQRGGERRVHEGVALAHRADRPDQILRRRALHHVAARTRRDRVREQPLVAVGGEDHHARAGRPGRDPLHRGDAVDPGQPDVHDHDLGLVPTQAVERLLARTEPTPSARCRPHPSSSSSALAHRRVVIHRQAA